MNAKTCPDENVTRALKARSEGSSSHLLSILQWPCRTKQQQGKRGRTAVSSQRWNRAAAPVTRPVTARGPGSGAQLLCAARRHRQRGQTGFALPGHAMWTLLTSPHTQAAGPGPSPPSAAADRTGTAARDGKHSRAPGDARHSDETRSTLLVLLGSPGHGTGWGHALEGKEQAAAFNTDR